MSDRPEKPTSKPKPSVPPKSQEQEEVDKALDAACAEIETQNAELDAATRKLRRTTSDQKMKAVRLPMPSQHEVDSPPAKR